MRSETPATLRRALRVHRRTLSEGTQRSHALAMARRLGQEPVFLHARRIGIYWPADGEIDPRVLLNLSQAGAKRWSLPVLCPHPQPRLWFLSYRPGEPTRPNRFGIPEPARRNRRLRLARSLDILLLPLVGFDADCNRMGMGAGYYDRTLGYLAHRRALATPAADRRRPRVPAGGSAAGAALGRSLGPDRYGGPGVPQARGPGPTLIRTRQRSQTNRLGKYSRRTPRLRRILTQSRSCSTTPTGSGRGNGTRIGSPEKTEHHSGDAGTHQHCNIAVAGTCQQVRTADPTAPSGRRARPRAAPPGPVRRGARTRGHCAAN